MRGERLPGRPVGTVRRRVVRLLLLGNHPLISQAIDAHLQREPDVELAGVAATVEEALALGDRDLPLPDVVLVLIPGLEGIDATRRITDHWSCIPAIVLSVDSRAALVLDALRAGASGYLTADSSVHLVCHAIRAAVEGGMLLGREPVRAALCQLGDACPRPASAGLAVALTARELEVLQLVADGCSNKEIGARLHLAVVTVKKYVQSVTGKLGVADRTQAAVRGVRDGIVR